MSAREELSAAVDAACPHEEGERLLDAYRAEVLREAAAHLRRTPRESRDYPAALTGARIIETDLTAP